jgi:hypothetical protein
LSATSITQPRCRVELPEGARESVSGDRDTDEEEEDTEDDEEERKIEGREVSAPSPTAQEQQDPAPIVNGGTTDLEGTEKWLFQAFTFASNYTVLLMHFPPSQTLC